MNTKVVRALLIVLTVGALVSIGVRQFLTHRSTPAAPAWGPIAEQRLSHGRFKDITVYTPHATPENVVLLLSGDEGWNPAMAGMANEFGLKGSLVVGIDLPKFNAQLDADGAQCVFPDGDLENLSHFVQAYFHQPTYLKPLLVGNGAGGTLAYAMLAQAPKSTFAGALSVGFCPSYARHKPLCKGSGVESTARAGDDGVDFLPSKSISNPWIVVPGDDNPRCSVESVKAFVAQVPGAKVAVAPAAASNAPAAVPAYLAGFDTLSAQNASDAPTAAPPELSDLPIVSVAAEPGTAASDVFAILLSGDGGWAGLDQEVAGALTASGIPVVGLDSLRYFWSARTPQGLANDLDRMIRYYLPQLGKKRVLLVGYSQGADVLPFAVNRLPPATAAKVALAAVMGMSEHALFEFHMSSWISDDNSGPATLPEVDRISGVPVLCIYGADETDTLCPQLDPHKVTVVKVKGGHHFDGDYAGLARTILASAQH